MKPRSRERYTDKLIAWWKPRLLLDKWAIIPKDSDEREKDRDGDPTVATNLIDPTNSESWLTTHPRFWEESEDYQDMTIGHELAHIHTLPVKIALDKAAAKRVISQKEAKDILEDLTNTIAKIVVVNARRKRSVDYHI